jgi:hypothetical protein
MALGRRPVQGYRVSGSYVDGRWTPAAPQPITVVASVQPLRGKELESLPEGRRQASAFKVYTDFALRTVDDKGTKMPDQLVVDGLKYEVIKVYPFQSGIRSHYKGIISLMEIQT